VNHIPCFQFYKVVQIQSGEVGNYSMFQLPTFYKIYLPKIIKIQRHILESQLKMLGILSMRQRGIIYDLQPAGVDTRTHWLALLFIFLWHRPIDYTVCCSAEFGTSFSG